MSDISTLLPRSRKLVNQESKTKPRTKTKNRNQGPNRELQALFTGLKKKLLVNQEVLGVARNMLLVLQEKVLVIQSHNNYYVYLFFLRLIILVFACT